MVTVYFIILSEVNNMEHIFDYNVTVKKFAHFVWPSILMMLMIGLYYNMDSIFVANLVGEQALAALSMAYPVQGIMWGFAVMLAAGSSAIVAIKMGDILSGISGIEIQELSLERVGRVVIDLCAEEDDAVHHET